MIFCSNDWKESARLLKSFWVKSVMRISIQQFTNMLEIL